MVVEGSPVFPDCCCMHRECGSWDLIGPGGCFDSDTHTYDLDEEHHSSDTPAFEWKGSLGTLFLVRFDYDFASLEDFIRLMVENPDFVRGGDPEGGSQASG